MAMRKVVDRLKEYFARLDAGKVQKIKPRHIKQVIEKLEAKKVDLANEIATASSVASKVELQRKLLIADEQLRRAQWLLDEVRIRRRADR